MINTIMTIGMACIHTGQRGSSVSAGAKTGNGCGAAAHQRTVSAPAMAACRIFPKKQRLNDTPLPAARLSDWHQTDSPPKASRILAMGSAKR